MTSIAVAEVSTTSPPIARPRRSRVVGVVRETTLNLMAIGGAVCLLGVIASLAFGLTLVMFKTGSMSPTIPAGSVALVREVPASHVHVGDVVTVSRTGRLPITHRVVRVAPGGDGSTLLTLRGDANPTPDPEPYEVRTVRLVETSVPGAAHVIAAAGTPKVLGLVTLLVAGAVTWTLWPRLTDDEDA